MLILLTCVLEDGSTPRGARVPANPCRGLRIPAESDVTLCVTVLRANGTPYDFAIDDTLVWTARRRPQDALLWWSKLGAVQKAEGRGCASFTLSASDTRSIGCGRGVYDVWLSHKDGGATALRDSVMPTSPITLEPTTTHMP